MPQRNPYTLSFGTEPSEIIPRFLQANEVVDAFCSPEPSQSVFMVTGVRGSGKTVFMTSVSNQIASHEGWIVVELNPERNLLEDLASKLGSQNELAKIFKSAKINLSFFGIGLEVGGSTPITNIELALARMLESIGKKGHRLLVTIDEVTASPQVKEFAAAFQIFLRQKLPIFLRAVFRARAIGSLEARMRFLLRRR